MSTVHFTSTMTVDLIDSMGDDGRIVRAARVSTKGANEEPVDTPEGLLRFLMKNRHGSPFEHVVMTFYVHAPIFVMREFMRHRIASYNEESGRYKQLLPVFYVPAPSRPLVQEGKAGAYEFVEGTTEQQDLVAAEMFGVCGDAYEAYENMLDQGVAREVARMVLPVNIYSSMYVTMNARSLMNFLSLRVKDDGSTYPSYPQHEIELVALQMEDLFHKVAPITHKLFVENGRVSP